MVSFSVADPSVCSVSFALSRSRRSRSATCIIGRSRNQLTIASVTTTMKNTSAAIRRKLRCHTAIPSLRIYPASATIASVPINAFPLCSGCASSSHSQLPACPNALTTSPF